MDYHSPVLLEAVLDILQPGSQKTFLDCTLGHGGHTLELLRHGSRVVGLDADPTNLQTAIDRIHQSRLDKNFIPINSNFTELNQILSQFPDNKVDGVLVDLGLSSNQQTTQNRGFSFNDKLSLDMRLNPEKQSLTAEEVINTFSYQELFDIFTKIGQEKLSKLIIPQIISARQKKPLKSAVELANIVRLVYQQKHLRSSIDPATKVFMSLRIYINQEFDNLRHFLEQTLLEPKLSGATVCLISFHSGEDRIVKQFIRSHLTQLTPLSTKGITASHDEIRQNPLSRSATLRSYKIN